jgi:hypothetical protein
MKMNRVTAVVGVAALSLILTGCQPDSTVKVVNKSSGTVTIQFVTTDGKVSDVKTLAPGAEGYVLPGYEDPDGECTKDAGFQAVDSTNAVVSQLKAICSKDEWVIGK